MILRFDLFDIQILFSACRRYESDFVTATFEKYLLLTCCNNSTLSRQSDFPTRVVRKELLIAVDSDDDMVLYLKGKLDLQEIMESQDIKIGGVHLPKISRTNL
jgi:hypothetical protein